MSNDNQNRTSMRPAGLGGGRHLGRFASKSKAKNTKGTFKRLWGYLSPKRGILMLVFLLAGVSSLFSLAGPWLIGKAIDDYIIPRDLDGLMGISMVLAMVYALGALTTWFSSYTMIKVSQETVKEMRRKLFDKFHTLPLSFFDSKSHGDLMSRLTNDVENVSNTLNTSVTHIFSNFIIFIGSISMMIVLSPFLTLLTLMVIPVMMITTGKIAKHTRKLFSEQQKSLGELNGFIEENISGMKVVKVFCHEEENMIKFQKNNKELKAIGTRAQIFSGMIPPFMGLMKNISFAIVAGAGGYLVVQDIVTIGVIASFVNYSKQFSRPLNELANQFNAIQSALAGAERVFEIMDEKPETMDEADAPVLTDVKGEVTFEDVSFGYKKDTPILKDVNINVSAGQTIALVGPTGAGKTTIVNLLTRFYDIDQGRIQIDGMDIREVQRNSLRSSLGMVLQDTYLFSESIRENIRYGRLDATDEEVEKAAILANADSFIRRLPQGYDTVLTEDAANLSQGQRQLIAIARAILADPAILILDEATSSVDTRTEVQIQEAMLTLMKGRTSFVIAHRLSTIKDADMILVLKDGNIIEKGNHEGLLEQKGFYYNLYHSQFRREVS